MTICTRCGKQRVIISSYQKKVEKSLITYTDTACPNPECQKLVDSDLKKEEIRRSVMRGEQERRIFLRGASRKRSSIVI